jgi:hypothetical protein
MATTSTLEKLINFVYGALIFLILVGILFAVYSIFWAEKMTVPEQNFESVFEELKVLKKNSDFSVVMRPSDEGYYLALYQWGNKAEGCAGKPCLCLDEPDKAMDCAVLPNMKKDCKEGPCVEVMSSKQIDAKSSDSVMILNENNKLSIK